MNERGSLEHGFHNRRPNAFKQGGTGTNCIVEGARKGINERQNWEGRPTRVVCATRLPACGHMPANRVPIAHR